jgi:DNA (cytosine-5)-methyltransferase 1
MDYTNTVTHVSLCAGYGGIDLGLKRAIPDLRTIAFSEIEGYACANLVAKMEAGLLDAAPIWTDLKTFPWSEFRGKVDILSGGYPCQPFSAAGKRLGTDDPRHLWPFIADGIRLMQPRVCFFENVEGHVSLGLRAVIEELGSLGYKTTWGIFSAREVGAPHQRKRIFILAHLIDERLQGRLCGRTHQEWKDINGYVGCGGAGGGIWPSRPNEHQYGWEPPRVVGNAAEQRLSERGCGEIHESRSVEELKRPDQIVGDTDCGRQSSRIDTGSCSETIGRGEGNIEQDESRQAEPSLGGDPYGTAHRLDHAELYLTCDNRTDELRLLGNGVVPAVAHRAFVVLAQRLSE